MKDLIEKLQLDANCALGAIWMHIDAQAARIAELEAQIAALGDEPEWIDGRNDDPAEAAFWRFDARKKGYGRWKGMPQSERDAFKAEYRAVASTALQAPVREVPETWIPIDDKLPEISEMVWCLRTDGRVLMASRKTDAPIAKREPHQDCYWWDYKQGANWSDVTVVAWSHITVPSAPLPAAPMQQEGGNNAVAA